MSKYKVIVTDEKTGAVIFTACGHSVIAGAAVGENASTLIFPSVNDEASVGALIDACENAFSGVLGDEDDEDDDFTD